MTFIIIAITLLLLELAYFRVASRFNITDKPNSRSSHKNITLRGGGIIFVLGTWMYFFFFDFQYPCFLIGLTLVGIIGLIDDIHSLPNWIRLIIQIIAVFLLLDQLGLQRWSSVWYFLVAWIVCIGITNAYNFMDGINGMTGGYSIAVIIPLIYLNNHIAFIDPSLLHIALLSLCIFCYFNFRKNAKCFAGDVGSLSVAFIVIFALGLLILKTKDFSYILFLAIYGIDSSLTICHRILLHENLGTAHRKHAYQIMANELEIPHIAVAGSYMILQSIISFGLILLPINHCLYVGLVLGVLTIGYLLFIKRYYYLHESILKTFKNEDHVNR